MKTDFETLKGLSTHTINHLKQAELIDFAADMRADLIEALATEYGVSFATDENIKEQAIEEVEEKFGADNLPENITETEMFNHARKEIIKSFNGENIGGLYLMESLHNIAIRVKNFMLNSDLVEDVYCSDEDLIDFLIEKIREFAPKRDVRN
ncbi:MAG: hypothetical protein K2P81_15655 [Bacteriovoracaceae bacterium]|nr:hypothetical protein [Bacteriovoracaceae bacterium]